MVFQSYALYPHMTVRDNLAFGLKLRKTPKAEIERRVKEAAAMLSLENLLNRKPRELSGGQRQRVALGRAIVREPAVFLMDEPLSNLDAKLRVETRAEIARLHQRLKVTTVYVTHDQVEAMTMGQRIAVMSEARLQQVGTPQSLYDHPVNRFVAGFIGSPSMNFLPVTATAIGDNMTLAATRSDDPAAGRLQRALVSGASASWASGPSTSTLVADRPAGHAPGQRRRRGVPGQRGAHPRQRRRPRTSWPSSTASTGSGRATCWRSRCRSTRSTCSTRRRAVAVTHRGDLGAGRLSSSSRDPAAPAPSRRWRCPTP